MASIKSILTGDKFHLAASVFNPLSAVMAYDAGFECGVVGGSVVAANLDICPDYGLITLSELVDCVRRISLNSTLPIIVDGDSGYGNALNTQRLVRELESVGAAAVTLEDSVLPFQYQRRHVLSSLDEHRDKLNAALEARKNNQFSIIARTSYQSAEGTPSLLKRIEAYSQTKVDALCIFGDVKQAELRIIRELSDKPIMLISYGLTRSDYRMCELSGVRVLLNGHHAFEASVIGMFNSYQNALLGKKRDVTAKEILSKYVATSKLDETAKRYMSL